MIIETNNNLSVRQAKKEAALIAGPVHIIEPSGVKHVKTPKGWKTFVPSEYSEQVFFVEWFEKRFPDVFIHSIPNGVHLSHSQRVKALKEGLRKGPSDLHVPEWRLYIEFKKVKGGYQSCEQRAYQEAVERAGGVYLLVHGFKHAVELVEGFYNELSRSS